MPSVDLTDEQLSQIDKILNGSGSNVLKSEANASRRDYVNVLLESLYQDRWLVSKTEIALCVVYTAIASFGLLANGLVFYTLLRREKLHTPRNLMVLNLNLADIIICVTCVPFTLIKLTMKNWQLGEFLCHVIPWLQGVNVFASTLTITCIAVDRHQAIVHATTVHDADQRWVTGITMIAVWVLSVVFSLPLLLFSRVEQKQYMVFLTYDMCLEDWPSAASRLVYASLVMLLQFVVPVSLLMALHWRICTFLRCRILQNPTTPLELNRAIKEMQRHRKNSALLMAIAAVFALCWFPLTLLNLLADLDWSMFVHQNFLLTFAAAHIVAMLSVCFNPIAYGWLNPNLRREILRVLCIRGADPTVFNEPDPNACLLAHKKVSYKAIQTDGAMIVAPPIQPTTKIVRTQP